MNKKFLLISLQKSGGGAIDALGLSNGLCANKLFHYLIISQDNELAKRFDDNEFRRIFKIKTFKSSLLDFVLQTFLFLSFIKLIKILLQIKPQVIFISHFHPWAIFVFFLKIFFKYKVFYGIHDNPFDPKEEGPPFMLFLEKLFLKNSDVIITYSKFIKNDLQRFVKNKEVKVLYLGIHRDIFPCYKKEFNLNKEYLTLLFFGRILPYKGLSVLLEAFEILKSKNLKINLIIAGKGEISKDNQEKIKKLDITLKNYWITNEELLHLLGISDIIVIPYKKATQSGPLNIALACGFPTIASNIGSFPEYIKDGVNGFLFEANNSKELAEKIEYFYFNREMLKIMGEKAFEIGKNFSWENTVSTLIQLIEK